MTQLTPNNDRLERWAQAVEAFPPERFNMYDFVQQPTKPECGTVCCAAGLLPEAFPGEWEYDHSMPRLSTGPNINICNDIATFFGIPQSEPGPDQPFVDHIIFPCHYPNPHPGRHQVAERIRSFKCTEPSSSPTPPTSESSPPDQSSTGSVSI